MAARTDGFGERLKAILKAMVLAEAFDGEFRFHWLQNDTLEQQHHVIAHREDIFSPDFLAAYHEDRYEKSRFKTLRPPKQPLAKFQAFIAASPAGVLLNQEPLSSLIEGGLEDLPGRMAIAFRRIGFTEALREAMAAAYNAVLPANAVALHLRAGDTIYGRYRFSNKAAHKALCYPIAKSTISDLLANGQYPLIFGQDAVTCRLLADRFGLPLATDLLPPDLSNMASVLCEIVLMSRCQEIRAAGSGFAAVASWIGGIPLYNSQRVRHPAKLAKIILEDNELDDPNSALPSLQRSFAYFVVTGLGVSEMDDSVLIDIFTKALRYDPGNAFYSLRKAELQARNGDLAAAEATLKQAVYANAVMPKDPLRLVLQLDAVTDTTVGPLNLTGYLNQLAVAGDITRPFTAYVAALNAEILRQPHKVRQMAELAVKGAPHDAILKDLIVKLPTISRQEVTPSREVPSIYEDFR